MFTNLENPALNIDLLSHGTRSGPPSNSPGVLNLKNIRRRLAGYSPEGSNKKGPSVVESPLQAAKTYAAGAEAPAVI